jgi:3-oxoacyl-[acyl-carrier protein] reductase
MNLGLDGARALVCGASKGLGAALAETLAAEGARVALAARDDERLQETAARVGGVALVTDLSQADAPAQLVERAVRALGGLDLLVVNSGGPPPGDFEALDEAAWTAAIDGTLLSALRLIRAALPHQRESERGSTLLVLSSSARQPIPGLTTSNVLRPGLAGLVKSLVGEIAPLRINALAPGRIATDRLAQLDRANAERTGTTPEQQRAEAERQIPLGRYGEPEELGRVGAFLLSPAASYVNGQLVSVDGGLVRALP